MWKSRYLKLRASFLLRTVNQCTGQLYQPKCFPWRSVVKLERVVKHSETQLWPPVLLGLVLNNLQGWFGKGRQKEKADFARWQRKAATHFQTLLHAHNVFWILLVNYFSLQSPQLVPGPQGCWVQPGDDMVCPQHQTLWRKNWIGAKIRNSCGASHYKHIQWLLLPPGTAVHDSWE